MHLYLTAFPYAAPFSALICVHWCQVMEQNVLCPFPAVWPLLRSGFWKKTQVREHRPAKISWNTIMTYKIAWPLCGDTRWIHAETVWIWHQKHSAHVHHHAEHHSHIHHFTSRTGHKIEFLSWISLVKVLWAYDKAVTEICQALVFLFQTAVQMRQILFGAATEAALAAIRT